VIECRSRPGRVRGDDRRGFQGRGTSPEIVERLLSRFAGSVRNDRFPRRGWTAAYAVSGCAHRSSFYAIRKAAPAGIYPSDIGCYTWASTSAPSTRPVHGRDQPGAGFDYAHRLSGNRSTLSHHRRLDLLSRGIPP